MEDFVKARAFKIADCLSSLVVELAIPERSILLTGWSAGCVWTMAFLIHVVNFPTNKVDLSKYIRGITLYGSSILKNTLPLVDCLELIFDRSTVSCLWISSSWCRLQPRAGPDSCSRWRPQDISFVGCRLLSTWRSRGPAWETHGTKKSPTYSSHYVSWGNRCNSSHQSRHDQI